MKALKLQKARAKKNKIKHDKIETVESKREQLLKEKIKERLALSNAVFTARSSILDPLTAEEKSQCNKRLEMFVRGRISRDDYMSKLYQTHPQKDIVQLNVKLLRQLALLSSENENQYLFEQKPCHTFNPDLPSRDQLQARMFLEAYKYGIQIVDADVGTCLYEGVKACLKNIIHVLILYKNRRDDNDNPLDIIKPFTNTRETVIKTRAEDKSPSGRNADLNDLNACKDIFVTMTDFGSFFDEAAQSDAGDECIALRGALKRKRDFEEKLNNKLSKRMLRLTEEEQSDAKLIFAKWSRNKKH